MDRRQLLSGIGVAAATITSPAVAAARGRKGRRRKGPPEHAGPPEHSNAPDHAGSQANVVAHWMLRSNPKSIPMTKEEYNRHWDDYDGPGQKIPFNTMEKLCGNIADEVEEGRLVPRGRVSTTSVSTDSPPSLEINNDILEKARQGNNSNRGGNGQ